jgi:hypothetical protein
VNPLHQVPGDNQCLRVAIASIFELPLEEVPFFGGQYAFEDPDGRWALAQDRDFREWLKARGLAFQTIALNDEGLARPVMPWGTCIAWGKTQRGTMHAVVWDAGPHWTDDEHNPPEAKYGRMLHDPHPDGTGLAEVEGWYCFVVRDPAVHARALAEERAHAEDLARALEYVRADKVAQVVAGALQEHAARRRGARPEVGA